MGMRFTVYDVHITKSEGFFKGGRGIPEQGTERKEIHAMLTLVTGLCVKFDNILKSCTDSLYVKKIEYNDQVVFLKMCHICFFGLFGWGGAGASILFKFKHKPVMKVVSL